MENIYTKGMFESFFEYFKQEVSWGKIMLDNDDIDMLLLTGSIATESADSLSDIDLFLVTSRLNQIKYALSPVTSILFDGKYFEISIVATEKMINDIQSKDHLFWWRDAKVIFYRTNELLSYFQQARSLSQEALKNLIWNKFALFEINLENIHRLRERGELLSIYFCIFDNMKMLSEALLAVNNIFVHTKWYGAFLQEHNNEIYQDFLGSIVQPDIDILLSKMIEWKLIFKQILLGLDFTEKEIDNWYQYNAERLLFCNV